MLAHAGWVGRLTHDDALADALIRKDISHLSIGEHDRAMLRYVEKPTLRPGTVEREDVEALREAGFSDPAIGDIAAHVGDMAQRAARYGLPLHPGTFE